ncbi:galactose-3-O-sulfotransferase 4-like, partial [Antrostomus carolinensis]|uniref:galactose-3-O-sulfotransferase 4-like n=1 Tax=Antrostomus carolinensis TaxID=279965 RepID=UPI0010A98730
VQKLMPNDTFYFSIIRDPGTLGESAFSYYRAVAPAFRRAPSLTHFLNNPQFFYDSEARGNHYARNLQWFDFGLPITRNQTLLTMILQQLETTFHFILLTEYFDESLILLRHALCWPDEDIMVFTQNSRFFGDIPPISPLQMTRFRAWNDLDWVLYTHLNRSFWKRAESFGAARLRREVDRLRQRRAALARRCLKGGGPLPARVILDGRLKPFQPPGRAQILGYALKAGLPPLERERCARFATPELQYKDILDRRQFG